MTTDDNPNLLLFMLIHQMNRMQQSLSAICGMLFIIMVILLTLALWGAFK